MKIFAFIVVRRYLCISQLDLLDKKKSRPSVPKRKFLDRFSLKMIQGY